MARTKKNLFIVGAALFLGVSSVMLFYVFSSASEQVNTRDEKVFVYVHGAGGSNHETPFVHNLKTFLKANGFADFKVIHYSWNSPHIQWRIAGARFKQGQEDAAKEGEKFKTNILQRYEKENRPYYIIAHSLGAYVVAKAFEYQTLPLRQLRGVFFLGAALPRSYAINERILPRGMKISNYYSEHFDRVLPLFYNNQGVKAGGQVGFDDITLFDNLRTTCTHSHKGMLVHRDYSTLAEAIGYLVMWQEQRYVDGRRYKMSRRPVTRGLMSWHDIYKIEDAVIDGESRDVLIQQRWNTRSYRIVIKDARGEPYQLAKGRSLHAMLSELGLFSSP